MTQPTRLLTPSQAAERLAEAGITVTEWAVRDWAKSGRLAFVRLPSGRFLFHPEDIDAIATATPARADTTSAA
jgi:predicted site-specific integrase-resolvase